MKSDDDLKELILKLTRKVDRLDSRISGSLTKPEKQTWVKVKTITTLTGWSKHELLAARKNHVITWKKNSAGVWYLLESIPELLIKKN